MLLCVDLPEAHARLAAGELTCASANCDAALRPWGYAQPRRIRVDAATTECYTPRRARCRGCGRTHVLSSARALPHRPDTAAVVGQALLAASTGLGYRQVALQVERPETTVRGWLRRAYLNANEIWSAATRRALVLDPMADPFNPGGHPLLGPVGALGQAIAAHVRRFGPVADPWSIAVVVSGGRLLAPPAPSASPRPPNSS